MLFLILLAESSLIVYFRYSLFFIPEMSAGFMFYVVQIIPVYFTWIL
jgi:hypothetical protein